MKSLMSALLYPCRKATELIEKRRIVTLHPLESLRLRAHISMCNSCARYVTESDAMDKALNKLTSHPDVHLILTQEQKDHIAEVVRTAQK
jgi:hypothetical protein